ncbi:Gfo/Idh/MocA family protein [Microlunatus sp. Y2014]|uniref:Gfo/Idh/MocA family protein n=1 Tax=Microlunatus sp. Y2014 TaxID=3418488 RepID=UPI003DA79290
MINPTGQGRTTTAPETSETSTSNTGTSNTGIIDVLLVGAGHRTLRYAGYAEEHPDQMRVVGVVDPNPVRRRVAAERFGIPAERQWERVADLPDEPVARAAINGTMDALHVPLGLALLDLGYDMLLEKPVSLDPAGLLQLEERASATGRTVAVCHVLRHAPFYAEIKRRVHAGEIGRVLSIDLAEQVAYDHMASAFVRGRWRNEAESGSSILLAKCSHDMDLMSWFAGPTRPVRATSAGSLSWFTEANAPAGSGTRCLTDCAIEESCAYSAKRVYVDLGRWGAYAWESLEHLDHLATDEEKLASLATDNPFGRCVWRTDNTVVDRQGVLVEFENGATGTMTMATTAAKGSRTIHLVGTAGEIEGKMEEDRFVLRRFDASGVHHSEEVVDTAGGEDFHGGGDLRLVGDFVAVLNGEQPSLSTTDLAGSVNGQLSAFAAEEGRRTGSWVELDEMRGRYGD